MLIRIRSMYAFMHRSGLHPGVKKWLYGITFLSFFVSNISLILSGFLGPLSLVLQPETTYWDCAAVVGRQREKKETPLSGEEGFSSSEFCLLHFSLPAAFCYHCGIVSGLGSERMKKREGGGIQGISSTLGAFGVPFPTPSSELNNFSCICQHQQCSFFGFTLN